MLKTKQKPAKIKTLPFSSSKVFLVIKTVTKFLTNVKMIVERNKNVKKNPIP